ncbi:class F sortase [Modestobacter roseus]|uniref:Sortase family protein n=1 Tax=Modestobacter roseus TaxID=1181884 RepID=A0A562ISL1_9ACTN|nr:class F sortase [Modestobacter roseus]MQA32544.1 sortase [Modestobacter roseus]TWH73816.1 sortase family protein [Modestobacter roseus]
MRPGRGTLLVGGVLLALSGCGAPAGPPAAGAPSGQSTPAGSPSTAPEAPVAAAAPVLDPATVPEPESVRIPAIGVRRDLVDLGLAGDGTAEVPRDFDDAGWFTGGGRPGSRGPTVLLGHVDSTAGPAVFADLRDLVPGDVVEVTVAGGAVARYAVTGSEQVPKDEFPTAAVFAATTEDVLRLITCTGDFDRGARSYEDNLVVTAERIG